MERIMKRIFLDHRTIAELGSIWAGATDEGICAIALSGGRRELLRILPRGAVENRPNAWLRALFVKLERYARGDAEAFDLPLLFLSGTPFQREVWRAIRTIPWGHTKSYAWLARAVKRPRAYRAVAQACGANPVPIIVPCHRVIASDGGIGGFSGGIARKRRLLALETIEISHTTFLAQRR